MEPGAVQVTEPAFGIVASVLEHGRVGAHRMTILADVDGASDAPRAGVQRTRETGGASRTRTRTE